MKFFGSVSLNRSYAKFDTNVVYNMLRWSGRLANEKSYLVAESAEILR